MGEKESDTNLISNNSYIEKALNFFLSFIIVRKENFGFDNGVIVKPRKIHLLSHFQAFITRIIYIYTYKMLKEKDETKNILTMKSVYLLLNNIQDWLTFKKCYSFFARKEVEEEEDGIGF